MPWVLGIVAVIVVAAVVAIERARANPQTFQVQLVPSSAVPLPVHRGDTIVAQAPKDGGTWTPPAVTSDSGVLAGGNLRVLASSQQAITVQVIGGGGTATIESFGPPAAGGVLSVSIATLNITIVG